MTKSYPKAVSQLIAASGQRYAYTSSLTRLILDHLLTLCRHLPIMDGADIQPNSLHLIGQQLSS